MKNIWRKWFPLPPDRSQVEPQLDDFYKCRHDYHEMTDSGDKTLHPQVQLLKCLVEEGCRYAEIGCGGGEVASLVAKIAHVDGYDAASLAIDSAVKRCPDNAKLYVASADCVPAQDEVYDGVYSFEVLEHLWNPLDAVKEMLRIAKPGAFVLISFPLYFSLDMHLPKKCLARLADILLAGVRYVHDKLCGVTYINVCPNLDGDIYPDCDLITAVMPENFVKKIESYGCEIEFWDTTYMCAQRDGFDSTLKFQRNTGRKFTKNFGDHLLMLARKK